MLWLFYSLACPFLTGIGNIFDKIATEKHKPDVRAFNALHVLPFALISAVLLFFHPPSGAILEGVLAGVILMISYVTYFKLFQETEVSRAMGLLYMFPIFTAIGAAVFFHEKLSSLQLFGILLVVAGSIILSATSLKNINKKVLLLGLAQISEEMTKAGLVHKTAGVLLTVAGVACVVL